MSKKTSGTRQVAVDGADPAGQLAASRLRQFRGFRVLQAEPPVGVSKDVLYAKDVARLFRAKTSTVIQFARTGQLAGAKLGNGWLFMLSDVMDFLREKIKEEVATRRHKNVTASTPLAVLVEAAQRKRGRRLPVLPVFDQDSEKEDDKAEAEEN